MVLELHHRSHIHLSVALSSAEVERVATTRITTTTARHFARTLTLDSILAVEATRDRCRDQAVDGSPIAMLVGGESTRALSSRVLFSELGTACCATAAPKEVETEVEVGVRVAG